MTRRRSIVLCCIILLWYTNSLAQQIDFGSYRNYSITVEDVNTNDLDFGTLVGGSGQHSVELNNAKIISIKGVEYLDVIVEVNAPNNLYLEGNAGNEGVAGKSIPFTLKAAYANNKGMPNLSQAKFITGISNNSFLKQFPILERQSQPPGPPPPPPTNNFEQQQVEEEAYIYLYGSINVGEVDAGSYQAQITIDINYD